jgi:DNA-binding PadR family transcriptional regulator
MARMTRMTHNALLVLRALMAAPGREMYGLEIMRAISLKSGTVYPLLDRIEAAGWATARDEVIDPQAEGRPRRQYYQVTPAGEEAAREEMRQEAARLAALGVTGPPQTDPLNIGGIEIPVMTDERQPPGIVSVVSAGLDRDGKAVVHAAHVNIGPDEAESVSEELCEHRIPPGSFCVRCGRLIGGLRLSYGLPARPPDSGAPRGTSARIQVDVGRKDPERRHRRGVLV